MLLYGEEMFVALGIGVERKEGWGLINVDCLITAMNKVEEEGGFKPSLTFTPWFLVSVVGIDPSSDAFLYPSSSTCTYRSVCEW